MRHNGGHRWSDSAGLDADGDMLLLQDQAGMAERALILTPASLVGQWREELETKFGLQFATTYDPLSRDDPASPV
jgi:SNF2 family DNA or RNA helicase